MGVRSTYDIDRATAQQVLMSNLYKLTNEQLASMLLDLEESEFRNYIVYDELLDHSDSDKVIRNINEF